MNKTPTTESGFYFLASPVHLSPDNQTAILSRNTYWLPGDKSNGSSHFPLIVSCGLGFGLPPLGR